jgi:hypothetical protein
MQSAFDRCCLVMNDEMYLQDTPDASLAGDPAPV